MKNTCGFFLVLPYDTLSFCLFVPLKPKMPLSLSPGRPDLGSDKPDFGSIKA